MITRIRNAAIIYTTVACFCIFVAVFPALTVTTNIISALCTLEMLWFVAANRESFFPGYGEEMEEEA